MLLMPKKTKKINPYLIPEKSKNIVQEPFAIYAPESLVKLPSVAEFTFKRFQKIADKIPFTQKEWANILHLSERTLQRYAKANSSFEGIYVDRILHIEQLINLGIEVFTDANSLYNWLKKDKIVFGKVLNFQSLYHTNGIQENIMQLGRILHNVYT